jgi:hypothetical protein
MEADVLYIMSHFHLMRSHSLTALAYQSSHLSSLSPLLGRFLFCTIFHANGISLGFSANLFHPSELTHSFWIGP